MVTQNRDTGSLFVGKEIPQEYQKMGAVAAGELTIKLAGETKVRTITFVMGSDAKGWFLCAKGQGPFPGGKEAVAVEFEINPK